MKRWADHSAAAWVLGLLAFAGAAAGARPFASSWNDGSRLASVEALVERGTFCIDGTTFLEPPAAHFENGTPSYDPDNPGMRLGTLDKLYISGHWYSDRFPGKLQDQLPHDDDVVTSCRLLAEFEKQHRGELRTKSHSLIHVGEHLAQMCLDGSWTDEPYFGQLISFDDLWASAHADLVNALLRFAARWDVLSTD